MANLMPEVARMLGVEIGEKFQINLCPNVLFKFDMSGILAQEQGEASWHSANRGILQELIYGSFEIMKLPWKPKRKDTYWTFYINDHDKLDTDWNIWTEEVAELARLKAGWVYRTREEAEAALPAVAAEMGVEYEL